MSATATTPLLWKVLTARLGAVDWMLLGELPTDEFRISLTVCDGEADAQVVYPCRTCGWDAACHNGEECHS